MGVRRETRSENVLAPVQVFNAVPSLSFSAPAELAGLGPGHSKGDRSVRKNRSAGSSKGVCPFGRRTRVREGEAGSEANVGRGLPPLSPF
jgi:hypothetical protein